MLFSCLPVADSAYPIGREHFLYKHISSNSVLCGLFASTAADDCAWQNVGSLRQAAAERQNLTFPVAADRLSNRRNWARKSRTWQPCRWRPAARGRLDAGVERRGCGARRRRRSVNDWMW